MGDNDLFLYDLAVVAIMKHEEPYVKEWLDYHLLAGVDHFFIYDNDSTPEFREILQPYIDEGIVTYTSYPGKCRQIEAYNDAVQRFKFECRYLAVIDGDEFIFLKSKSTVNIHHFGSNNLETADYDMGVLERFTRRAGDDWAPISKDNPEVHDGTNAVNENCKIVNGCSNFHVTAEKIVMNHYHTKSYEEYKKKVSSGNADHFDNHYKLEQFQSRDHNEVFDEGILNYVDARLDALTLTRGGVTA